MNPRGLYLIHPRHIVQPDMRSGHHVVVSVADRLWGLFDEGRLDDAGDLLFGGCPIELRPIRVGRRRVFRRINGKCGSALLQKAQGRGMAGRWDRIVAAWLTPSA